jgi:hypothetical protein
VINQMLFASSYWTPASIPTIFWYDAADTATITATGSQVTQVLDKSGNSRTLTRAAGTVGPNTGTRNLNGLNVFEYTGNNCLENTAFAYDQAASRLYIAMVLQVDSSAIAQHFFMAGRVGSTTAGTRLSGRFTSGNTWEIIGGSNTGVNQQMGGGAAVRDQPYILLPKFNAATSAWRVNGAQTNTGNIGTNPFTIISLGHNETESQDLDGYIAETIAFSDAANQEITEGYLAWKWGLQGNLPAGHPYKNSRP